MPRNVTSLATQVKLASNNANVVDGGQVISSTTVYDTATLSGQSSNAGGSVTYYVEKGDAACSIAGATALGTKTVTNGVIPKSDNYTFPSSGVYDFWAVYTPDNNNLGSTSTCGTETVIVTLDTGAKTIGYWQNKNGQGIIKSYCGGTSGTTLYSYLTQFNPFKDLTSATCTNIATYVYNIIKAANANGSSMNAMLKAQMLATALDVYFSDPALGGNRIGAPGPIGSVLIDLTKICKMIDSSGGVATCSGAFRNVSPAFGGATSMTVSQMLAYAASQSNGDGSEWYTNVKATQELAKDAFDAINNNVVFAP